ncbi:hypothetical protein Tco_0417206 [Tanacetum coccineum]
MSADASILSRSVFARGDATGAALKILAITSLKYVLTQEHLDAICAKYFVPEEVHPQLPSSDATMHERPADRAPAPSEYNVEHVNTLIAQASPFLRFPEEFLCWVGISRNYLLNKDTYPRFEYENGEEMDLNAFIHTADPRKVRIIERARAENESPIVMVAKHHTVTLLPTLVDNAESVVPITDKVETEISMPKRIKKKRVTCGSERTPAASHPPKRLRADYGTTGSFATRGKSPSVLNRLLQDSWLLVEQGVPALPTLPFITSSVTASPFEEGRYHTDSVTSPFL